MVLVVTSWEFVQGSSESMASHGDGDNARDNIEELFITVVGLRSDAITVAIDVLLTRSRRLRIEVPSDNTPIVICDRSHTYDFRKC